MRMPIWLRLVVGLLCAVGIVVIVNLLVAPLLERLAHSVQLQSDTISVMIALALLVYVVLLAIPFVPGAEVGMILLGLGGAPLAPLVYGATVLSLLLAFAIGRLVPEHLITKSLTGLGLTRAAALSARFEALPVEARPRALQTILDGRMLPMVLKYRYIALILAINLPGNVLIGGGGGIALAAGLSRMFRPNLFLLATLLAVLPVPLLIVLYGKFWPI